MAVSIWPNRRSRSATLWARNLDAGREGCVLRLNRRLRYAALAHMGGHELRVHACSIDDGGAGNEYRKHETPYPGRDAPSAGEPSGTRNDLSSRLAINCPWLMGIPPSKPAPSGLAPAWPLSSEADCTLRPHGRDMRIATDAQSNCERLCNFRWDQCMKSGWWAGRLSRAAERR
jgi:hypothetical protein